MSNALLHGFEGSSAGQVTLQALTVGYKLSPRVRDDCGGIAAKHLTRVFEPFFSTRFGHGGSGLGPAHLPHPGDRCAGGASNSP